MRLLRRPIGIVCDRNALFAQLRRDTLVIGFGTAVCADDGSCLL